MLRTKRILLAQCQDANSEAITRRLEETTEYVVDLVDSGYGVLASVCADVPEALLLDTSLLPLPGSNLCRQIRARERTAHLPVILMDDPGRGVGLVDGLALGADDYLVKPVDLDEMEARLRAVLRRRVHQHEEPQHFKGRHLDANFVDVCIAVDGAPVYLTKREFQLLRFFVHYSNQVLRREQLLTHVWGSHRCDLRNVDSAVWKLRTKLGRAGPQIQTVIGLGYRFHEPSDRALHAAEGH